MENEIFFKKQFLGKWRRTDKDGSKHVNEESMFREIEKLANDGWQIEPHGISHIRAITLRQKTS
jgi:hypothetical protein